MKFLYIITPILFLFYFSSCDSDNPLSPDENGDELGTVTGTLTDIDGNVYQAVKIGNQWWMAENLRVTRYRNGDAIPSNRTNFLWINTTSGASAIYPHGEVDGINSDAEMVAAYGKLYNWYAVVDSRGLCPPGWHVPSDDEWTVLINYLGGRNAAGGKLKSTRTYPDAHPRWWGPNTGATNESGFSGLPGGWRIGSIGTGGFGTIEISGEWWSSAEPNPHSAWYLTLNYLNSGLGWLYIDKTCGKSVRCIKNN